VETVTISPKFQVVIPKSVREHMRLRPGQKVQLIVHDERIELVLRRPITEMRGFLRDSAAKTRESKPS